MEQLRRGAKKRKNFNILALPCFTSLFITLQQKGAGYVDFWFYKLSRFRFV
jgi:hypothetical protein